MSGAEWAVERELEDEVREVVLVGSDHVGLCRQL